MGTDPVDRTPEACQSARNGIKNDTLCAFSAQAHLCKLSGSPHAALKKLTRRHGVGHLRRLPVYALMQARKEHKKGAVKLRNDNPELHSPRFPSFGIPRACARMVLKNQLRVAAERGLFQRDFDVRLVRPEVQGRRSRSV
jgi:hypothetical protein